MPLVIDDKTLEEAGLTEQQAKIEFACSMFASRRIDLKSACAITGLDRISMHQELGRRGIDSFGYTAADFEKDLKTLNQVLSKP